MPLAHLRHASDHLRGACDHPCRCIHLQHSSRCRPSQVAPVPSRVPAAVRRRTNTRRAAICCSVNHVEGARRDHGKRGWKRRAPVLTTCAVQQSAAPRNVSPVRRDRHMETGHADGRSRPRRATCSNLQHGEACRRTARRLPRGAAAVAPKPAHQCTACCKLLHRPACGAPMPVGMSRPGRRRAPSSRCMQFAVRP